MSAQILITLLLTGRSRGTDVPFSVSVQDQCGCPVTDAAIISARTRRTGRTGIERGDLPPNRWSCADGTCSALIDDSVIELVLDIRSTHCNAEQEETVCWTLLQNGHATVRLTPGSAVLRRNQTDSSGSFWDSPYGVDQPVLASGVRVRPRENLQPSLGVGDSVKARTVANRDRNLGVVSVKDTAAPSKRAKSHEELIGSVRVSVPDRLPTEPLRENPSIIEFVQR